ncbi:hypothetical protein CBR_g26352 [Chara braunii]|uniref:Uncharacterized protein n=1 Tax=Chara braunii TaxID=69332 RepID=A0A388L7T0_CHABU|nr:hypothetical protein CBR_g26352 [Chara braunii]|eukprot:GBG78324.1 hypothetical protein CBR_g26352 [Chara braunii]
MAMSSDPGGGGSLPGGGELPHQSSGADMPNGGGGPRLGLDVGSAAPSIDPSSSSSKFRVTFPEMKRPPPSKERERDGGGAAAAAAGVDGPSPAERKWYMKRPSELIAEQTAKGFDEPAASRRVIQQLQGMLAVQSVRYPVRLRKIEEEVSSARKKMEEVQKKVDLLADKVDGKPDFAAVALTGFSSAAFGVFLNRAPDIWRSLMEVQQSLSSVVSRKAD